MYVTLLALTLLFEKANGQEMYSLPKIINPSPQSMAFTRYGDYPMAAHTGLTDISVPLHNITGSKLSLPMSISFHASGRMANEVNGILGMRWTLNCGGLVTRTMKGNPDEWNNLTPYVVNPNNIPSFDDLYAACPDGRISTTFSKPFYDSEFDIFSYALPNGKQGHFILKNENGVKVPMLIPYSPLKIEMTTVSQQNGYFDRIQITDVDGTKYFFGKVVPSTENAIEIMWFPDQTAGQLGNVPTAWYLTKIVSSDGADEISLSYNYRREVVETAAQHAKIYDRRRNSSTLYIWENCEYDPYECNLLNRIGYLYYWEQSPPYQIDMTIDTKMVPVLAGVQFNGGSISLSYNNNNNDLLNEVIIKRESVAYKKIKFDFSNHTAGDVIYHLDSLAFYGENQNIVNEKYRFSYYAGGNDHPQPEAKKDWWGNYCQNASNLLPYQPAEPVSYLVNNWGQQDVGFVNVQRDAVMNNKIMGMLKTITYPTGGNTEFIYQENMYNYGGAPGIRIAEIISNPVIGNKVHKIYRYGTNEDGYGFINEYLRPGSVSRRELSIIESNAMHFWTYYTNAGGGSSPIPWPHYEQMGFRMRDYLSDPYITFDLQSSQIKYNAVTEYYMENGYPRQKTCTYYSWGDDAQLSGYNVTDNDEIIHHPRKFSDPQNACLTPVMTSKVIYKYANDQFEQVRKETYEYDYMEKDEAWDMPTYAHTSVVYARLGSNGFTETDYYNTAKDYHNTSCSVYGYGYRKYKSGSQSLLNTTVEEVTPGGTVVTQSNMNYEPNHHLLRSQEVTNSRNEVVKTTYNYPKDFASVSPYSEMVNRNIISPVVEQISANITLNKELGRARTNYSLWQNNAFVNPATIQKSIAGNALETEVTIDAYDEKGNIIQVTGKDGIVTAYIWGYNQKYPVAKIIGKTYADAVTLSGVSLLVVNNSASTDAAVRAELHKLRALSGCFVSTYTYKPLTGITSETDAGGRTIYYEYDLFGRLKYTRDKDNNILKKYAYDFQGQCTNCGTISNANWQATANTRAKPCELDNTYNSLYGQQEEKDMNPASSTYNQSRWIDFYIPFGSPLYDVSLHNTYEQYWTNTATAPRCIQNNGQNTGEQEREQSYLAPNPCHPYRNKTRWVNLGMNTNACPLPALFNSSDLSGIYYSTLCTSPAEPTPIYVSVPAGQFTSSISAEDANVQALQYAQTYANQHGECVVPPITLNLINNSGDGLTVTLTNTATNQTYVLHSVNGSNVYLPNLPQGIYNIYIEPAFSDWRTYEIGCSFFTETTGEVWVDDVPFNVSCNTININ